MFTAVADASHVAEARRLVGDLARRIGLPRGADRPGGDRRHRACHQSSEARRRRPYPRRQVRRCRGHRAGSAGTGSRRRHGRSGSLHGGRLLDRRQPRQRARCDRAPGRHRADLFASGAGLRDHGALRRTPSPRRPDAARRHSCALSRRAGVRRQLVVERHRSSAARSCWSMARATASRQRVRRRPPCGRSAENADAACEVIVERIHRALAPTRGGALAVARIDTAARVVRFVGVGNISAMLVNAGRSRHMVSHNGTAGHVAPRIREFTYDFTGDPLVDSALRRTDQPLGFRRLSGARRAAPVAGRRRAAARSPARS